MDTELRTVVHLLVAVELFSWRNFQLFFFNAFYAGLNSTNGGVVTFGLNIQKGMSAGHLLLRIFWFLVGQIVFKIFVEIL